MDAQAIQSAALVGVMVTSTLSFVAGWRSRARVERKVCQEQYRAFFCAYKAVFAERQDGLLRAEPASAGMGVSLIAPALWSTPVASPDAATHATPDQSGITATASLVPKTEAGRREKTPHEVSDRHGDALQEMVHELDADDLEEVGAAELEGVDVSDVAVTHAIDVRALMVSIGLVGAK